MKALILLASALAVPAAAQAPGRYPDRRPDRIGAQARPESIAIAMTDDGFAPRRIDLRGGAPYVLRVTNRSSKGHNLSQKSFFQNARVAPEDRGWTRDGHISLRPGESATVHLRAPDTRPGGTYEFSSTSLGDAGSGYKGVFTIR